MMLAAIDIGRMDVADVGDESFRVRPRSFDSAYFITVTGLFAATGQEVP